jgi:hypothetical protein
MSLNQPPKKKLPSLKRRRKRVKIRKIVRKRKKSQQADLGCSWMAFCIYSE